MKKTIFNVVVYSMLAWSIFSATYLALPIEYQEMLPDMNWLTALVSGGSTALFGSGALFVKTLLDKTKIATDEKVNLVASQFIELVNKYDEVTANYNELVKSIDYNNLLLQAELKTKLTNPLITEESKALIEQVLTNENEG